MAGELKDNTYDDMADFVVTEFVEQVLGGRKSLRSAARFAVDVISRWGVTQASEETLRSELKRRKAA